ncbi:hypothetical protein [Curtobacterium sp. TXMA1]|uniref:hypothetical protein n=1 Tax=Curtobacterium sp. TXMA1 TaxID=2876939 RepID=UPI001CCE4868|nr:hypothetical protein [Curtobacterium sp. TXMA1]UBQ02755.1 hypothetical protein LCG91_00865 [Curtobacterium sp. TXMA1]
MTQLFALVNGSEYEIDAIPFDEVPEQLLSGEGIASVPVHGGGVLSWVKGPGCPVVILRRV